MYILRLNGPDLLDVMRHEEIVWNERGFTPKPSCIAFFHFVEAEGVKTPEQTFREYCDRLKEAKSSNHNLNIAITNKQGIKLRTQQPLQEAAARAFISTDIGTNSMMNPDAYCVSVLGSTCIREQDIEVECSLDSTFDNCKYTLEEVDRRIEVPKGCWIKKISDGGYLLEGRNYIKCVRAQIMQPTEQIAGWFYYGSASAKGW